MASPALQLLVQINSNLQGIQQTINGLQQLQRVSQQTAQQVTTTWGGAFKFAAAEEALRRLIDGVKEVGREIVNLIVDFTKESINKAAEIQTEQFPLIQMLRGTGVAAEEILGNLHSLWQKIGVVSNEALGSAARDLLLIGVPAENLTARLIELSKVSIGTGVGLNELTGAYQRLRQAIEHETEPMIRGTGAFGRATLALFDELKKSLDVGGGELKAMFKAGAISIDDLNVALRKAASEGGTFANAFEEKKATFQGAVDAMKTAWQGFQFEVGKPLIDWATPIINKTTDIIKAFAKIAEEHGWSNALKLAWEVLIDEVALLWTTTMTAVWGKMGPAFANAWRAMWEALNDELKKGVSALRDDNLKNLGNKMGAAFTKAFAETFALNLPQEIEDKRTLLEGAINSVLNNLPTGIGKDLLTIPGETAEETERLIMAKALAAAMHDLDSAMARIRQQQNLINSAPFMGIDEKQKSLLASYTAEVGQLETSMKRLEQLKPLNEAQIAEVNQKLQESKFRLDQIRQAMQGLAQPFRTELVAWANSIGTTAHQVATTIQQTIGAALQSVNQFLVTGKFNAQQLLQQIVLLGLQLVEQMIIQRALMAINAAASVTQAGVTGPAVAAAWGPAATAVSVATEGAADVTATAAFAAALASIQGMLIAHKGGPIGRGGRGMRFEGLASDEVHLIGQDGEIMIRRSVAQRYRNSLLALNAGVGYQEAFNPELGGIPPWHDPGLGFPSGHLPGPPMHMPGLGPQVITPRGTEGPRWASSGYDPHQSSWLNNLWSYFPPGGGFAPGGPTNIPTTWTNYPGVGWVPNAIPIIPQDSSGQPHIHLSSPIKTKHSGGEIGGSGSFSISSFRTPRFHAGGAIVRMHGGGALSGGGSGGATGSGEINIYAFTDPRDMTRHMASRAGQKIIFDTIKGRRIDLGIK